MKKVGLSTSNELDSNIFSYDSYQERLKIQDGLPPLKKIYNIIINSEVIRRKFKASKLLITILVEVKIIYTSYMNSKLYVSNKNIIKSLILKLPINISEEVILGIENNNIKVNINIYDVNGIIESDSDILIGFFIMATLPTIETEDVMFIASFNNLKDNIYTLEGAGKELVQNTFYCSEYIDFADYENELLLIKQKKDCKGIYIIDSSKIIEIKLPYKLSNPVHINEVQLNTYLITDMESEKCILYILLNEALFEIANGINVEKNKFPIFNKRDNSVLYIGETDNKSLLIYSKLTENKEKDSVYKLENYIEIYALGIEYYTLSYYGKYIGYVLNKDKVIIIVTNTRFEEEVTIPLKEYSIKKIQFSKNEKLLILLIRKDNCDDIYIYYILTKRFKKVTNNIDETIISSFIINNIDSYIYISDNSRGCFNLYKVSLSSFEVKETLILDADNIKILGTKESVNEYQCT